MISWSEFEKVDMWWTLRSSPRRSIPLYQGVTQMVAHSGSLPAGPQAAAALAASEKRALMFPTLTS